VTFGKQYFWAGEGSIIIISTGHCDFWRWLCLASAIKHMTRTVSKSPARKIIQMPLLCQLEVVPLTIMSLIIAWRSAYEGTLCSERHLGFLSSFEHKM
jgi:hypothetical protein